MGELRMVGGYYYYGVYRRVVLGEQSERVTTTLAIVVF
jgi:hypothetical protein